jgi:hypothetical protein
MGSGGLGGTPELRGRGCGILGEEGTGAVLERTGHDRRGGAGGEGHDGWDPLAPNRGSDAGWSPRKK